MTIEYCWGDRHIPYPILSESPTAITILLNGRPVELPPEKIVGRCSVGDRVRCLTLRGNWKTATIAGYENGLILKFSGAIATVKSMRNLQLEIFGGEATPSSQIAPLAVGDRVKIVLIGPPLESFLGEIGTVKAVGATGLSDLISVRLDCDGSIKLFRRQALDWLHEVRPPPLGMGASCLVVGDRVTHARAFKGHVGVIQSMEKTLAFVRFGAWPVYPALLEQLQKYDG